MKEYFLCYEFNASEQEVKLSVLRIHCKRAGNDAFCIKNSLQVSKK